MAPQSSHSPIYMSPGQKKIAKDWYNDRTTDLLWQGPTRQNLIKADVLMPHHGLGYQPSRMSYRASVLLPVHVSYHCSISAYADFKTFWRTEPEPAGGGVIGEPMSQGPDALIPAPVAEPGQIITLPAMGPVPTNVVGQLFGTPVASAPAELAIPGKESWSEIVSAVFTSLGLKDLSLHLWPVPGHPAVFLLQHNFP
jgi:hypothetical protein